MNLDNLGILDKAKECKKQWNSLRDCYRRALKKRKKVKSAQIGKIRKWKYENELSFLVPFIKERKSNSQFNMSTNDKSDVDITSNICIDMPCTQQMEEQASPEPRDSATEISSAKKRIRRRTEAMSPVFMDFISSNKYENTQPRDDTNDIDLFFQSMASTVKKFSPYNQAVAKARIFSIISEVEIQALSSMKCTHCSPYSLDSISLAPTPTLSIEPQPEQSILP
ncbi:PREDICTED: uncharacterized protein LOC108547438 [Eufriesea mexicana]|uniref:uncharacterized protein LOC108547438 n=1 Tax=Eufriesea mexicana TaxID=516756 RepID=UPI00083C0BEB|nr:PREDICTED: uncharacterized protein LOC108547438 [Eufriesea mexicana]